MCIESVSHSVTQALLDMRTDEGLRPVDFREVGLDGSDRPYLSEGQTLDELVAAVMFPTIMGDQVEMLSRLEQRLPGCSQLDEDLMERLGELVQYPSEICELVVQERLGDNMKLLSDWLEEHTDSYEKIEQESRLLVFMQSLGNEELTHFLADGRPMSLLIRREEGVSYYEIWRNSGGDEGGGMSLLAESSPSYMVKERGLCERITEELLTGDYEWLLFEEVTNLYALLYRKRLMSALDIFGTVAKTMQDRADDEMYAMNLSIQRHVWSLLSRQLSSGDVAVLQRTEFWDSLQMEKEGVGDLLLPGNYRIDHPYFVSPGDPVAQLSCSWDEARRAVRVDYPPSNPGDIRPVFGQPWSVWMRMEAEDRCLQMGILDTQDSDLVHWQPVTEGVPLAVFEPGADFMSSLRIVPRGTWRRVWLQDQHIFESVRRRILAEDSLDGVFDQVNRWQLQKPPRHSSGYSYLYQFHISNRRFEQHDLSLPREEVGARNPDRVWQSNNDVGDKRFKLIKPGDLLLGSN